MLNTEQFLQTTTAEVLDDRLDPCPAGEWRAQAGAPEIKDFTYKSGDREGQQGFRMVIRWEILDEEVMEQLDREKVTVQQSVLLDLNETQDGLDFGKGKNIGLGQIRTALGQNEPGADWSPAMIESGIAVIKVSNDVYKDNLQANVDSVRPAE